LLLRVEGMLAPLVEFGLQVEAFLSVFTARIASTRLLIACLASKSPNSRVATAPSPA
jgi:hypothetical protein